MPPLLLLVCAVLAILPACATAIDLEFNDPVLPTECESTILSWTGGTPPYSLNISGPTTEQRAGIHDFLYTWKVDMPAGSTVTAVVTDSNGMSARTQPFTIRSGLDSSCLISSSSKSYSTISGDEQ